MKDEEKHNGASRFLEIWHVMTGLDWVTGISGPARWDMGTQSLGGMSIQSRGPSRSSPSSQLAWPRLGLGLAVLCGYVLMYLLYLLYVRSTEYIAPYMCTYIHVLVNVGAIMYVHTYIP